MTSSLVPTVDNISASLLLSLVTVVSLSHHPRRVNMLMSLLLYFTICSHKSRRLLSVLFLNTQPGTVSGAQVLLDKHTLACAFHGTNVSRQGNTMTSL